MFYLKDDRAENSIMQTITIAVSAILIAAGLVTAPGLINNARDNNAKTDLANIAYAQEFVLSVQGTYFDGEYVTIQQEMDGEGVTKAEAVNNLQYIAQNAGLSGLGTSVAVADEQQGVSFTLSGEVTNHTMETCEAVPYYLLKDKSASGKWFYRGSGSADTSSDFSQIANGIPTKVLDACPGFGGNFEEAGGNSGNPSDPGNDDEAPFTDYSNADYLDMWGGTVIVSTEDIADVAQFPWKNGLSLGEGHEGVLTDIQAFAGGTDISSEFTNISSGTIAYYYDDDTDEYPPFVEFDFDINDLLGLFDSGNIRDFFTDGWFSATIDGVPNNTMRIQLDSDTVNSVLGLGDPNIGSDQAHAPYAAYDAYGRPYGMTVTFEDFIFGTNIPYNNNMFMYDSGQDARLGNMEFGEAQILSVIDSNGDSYTIDLNPGYGFYGQVEVTYDGRVDFSFRIRSDSDPETNSYDADEFPSGFRILDSSSVDQRSELLWPDSYDVPALEDGYLEVLLPGATESFWLKIKSPVVPA